MVFRNGRKVNKETAASYADLIKRISQKVNDERASKCGYDLFMGLVAGNIKDRAEAWENYLDDPNGPCVSEERDGCWVPAIPWKP